jgi:hypothetical protein
MSRLIIWGGLGIVFLGILWWNYTTFVGSPWSADPNSTDCIKSQGVVTDIHASGGSARKSKETYHLTFEYTVDGESYDSKEQVTYNLFAGISLGDQVDICYMKDHPGRAAVLGNDIGGENALIVLLADIGVLVAIVLIVGAAVRQRKKERAAQV